MAMSTGPDLSQSLWDEACKRLPEDLKVTIQDIEVQRVGILEEISNAVTKGLDAHHGQSLKFKKPGGGEVVVRVVLERYIKWLDCFKAVGDSAIQYDPGHAALPWAAVRFVLQSAVNTAEAFNILITNLEKISHMIRQHALSEFLYKRNTTPIGQELRSALKTLYTSILTYLARAIRYLRTSRLKRLAGDAFKLRTNSEIDHIQELDAVVDKLFHLVLAHESAEVRIQVYSVGDIVKRLEPRIEQTLRLNVRKDEGKEWLEYLKWLSPIDFEDQHREVRSGRLKDSAEWIMQHEEVAGWRRSDSSSMLLIDGVPGSGKSTLASKVIDSLKEHSKAVDKLSIAYFYCRRSIAQPERQSPQSITASLLRQLVVDPDSENRGTDLQAGAFAEFRKRKEKATRDGFQLQTLSSAESIGLISSTTKLQHVFIVLDGFDEVEPRQRIELAESLKSLLSDPSNLVKVLITSRDDSQVTSLLSGARGLRISPGHNKDDIERLIRYRLGRSKTAGQGVFAGNPSADFENQVCDSLLRSSGEMFLLAELQLQRLSLAETEADGRQVLVSLPEDITAAYEDTMGMMKNSGSRSFEIAVKTFQWLLYAKAPISVNALIYAIYQANFGPERPENIDATSLVRICRNLIKVDGPAASLNHVRFAHSTVQEFLIQRPEFAVATSNAAITSSCLQICTEGIADDLSTGPESMTEFQRYATLYWPLHYQEAPKGALSRQLSKFVYDESQGSSLSFKEWMEDAQNLSKELPRDHALRRDYLRHASVGMLQWWTYFFIMAHVPNSPLPYLMMPWRLQPEVITQLLHRF
ncbi:ankyrin 1 [Colletotrichum asianum]